MSSTVQVISVALNLHWVKQTELCFFHTPINVQTASPNITFLAVNLGFCITVMSHRQILFLAKSAANIIKTSDTWIIKYVFTQLLRWEYYHNKFPSCHPTLCYCLSSPRFHCLLSHLNTIRRNLLCDRSLRLFFELNFFLKVLRSSTCTVFSFCISLSLILCLLVQTVLVVFFCFYQNQSTRRSLTFST